ncbi:hypothetical protein [Microcoleus sp. bin38.metabat.b11b12b14.051]|nr:hypothetical protein [Microcoleus sp. bin38.metabat.b11b12b14.051]
MAYFWQIQLAHSTKGAIARSLWDETYSSGQWTEERAREVEEWTLL